MINGRKLANATRWRLLDSEMMERSSAGITVAVVVVVSFVLTQLLLACLQRKRLQRIEEKSLSLCAKAGTRQVPITVITGFLGSGKTTLVNRVLTADHGKRVVVIENELGSVSIDHSLIDEERQKAAPHGVLVLKNGCMCCSGESPGGELERVLDKLLEMLRVEQGALAFDYVLIETSGLADVGPILQVLTLTPTPTPTLTLALALALALTLALALALSPTWPHAAGAVAARDGARALLPRRGDTGEI